MTALDHLNTTFIDRDNGMKEGGGKLIIISQRVNYHLWQPEEGVSWVNSERAWVLVHNNSEKLAICSTYSYQLQRVEHGDLRDSTA